LRRCFDTKHRSGWVDWDMRLGRFYRFTDEPWSAKDAWWEVVTVYPPQPEKDNDLPDFQLVGLNWLNRKVR